MSTNNIEWIFPKLKHENIKNNSIWKFCSASVIGLVGIMSKLIVVCLNRTRVYNKHILENAVANRPAGIPLLTVSNHHSCFDDPGIWGVLDLNLVCNKNVIRWSMAAHDICFTNKYHSLFFMYGKCIPVVRGGGVNQPAVDLCIEKLRLGEWVHIFPEGKVNMTKEVMRLKWGVGRIVFESWPSIPLIIPIWHEGMELLLPNEPPYYFRLGQKLTYNFGQPIDLNETVRTLRQSDFTEVEARKIITDKIQAELMILKEETESLHAKDD